MVAIVALSVVSCFALLLAATTCFRRRTIIVFNDAPPPTRTPSEYAQVRDLPDQRTVHGLYGVVPDIIYPEATELVPTRSIYNTAHVAPPDGTIGTTTELRRKRRHTPRKEL